MKEHSGIKILIAGGHGGRSGVPSYINQLALVLGRKNHVEIVCDTNEGVFDPMQPEIVAVHEVPGLFRNLNPFRILSAGHGLFRLTRAMRPDLVWANSTITVMLARIVFTLAPGSTKRLITTYHGVPFGPGRKLGLSTVLRLIEYATLLMSRRHELVFISEKDRNLIPRRLARRHRIWNLENCSSLKYLKNPETITPETPIRIKLIGRVSYQKNILAAADLLRHLSKHCQLEIVGDGSRDIEFQSAFLRRLPERDQGRVKFTGECTAVPDLLARTDVLLFTSLYEGMSIAALEAFQAGVPVASTDVGGVEEYASATRYFTLIDLSNEEEMDRSASAVENLVLSFREELPKSRTEIRAAWAERFSLEIWQSRVTEIVQANE